MAIISLVSLVPQVHLMLLGQGGGVLSVWWSNLSSFSGVHVQPAVLMEPQSCLACGQERESVLG